MASSSEQMAEWNFQLASTGESWRELASSSLSLAEASLSEHTRTDKVDVPR
ncbi:hypothetical protein A2U01_0085408 [Trifolium medium]|uniref:Uncharacterized protein n=1 Tax=Trifolium medium TaxID=97028 RepID=A0A392TSH7_9FABA|nr:hypothetical protein [Trifolium medium]